MEAEAKLKMIIPQAGFLQKIKTEETKALGNNNFSQSRKIHKSLNANVSLWLKYSCKYHGEFYVTAVIPKDNVTYLEQSYPKKMTLSYIKKFCRGHDKIMIIGADVHYKFHADKVKEMFDADGYPWKILCGDAKVKAKDNYYYHKFENTFDNFKAILLFRSPVTHGLFESNDITIDMWMELTKQL